MVYSQALHHFTHLKLALHKLISGKLCVFLMYMYSWDMRIWCPNSLWCSSLLPFVNKVRFSSMLKGQKDCGMTVRAPLALVIGFEPDVSLLVWITYLVVEILNASVASYATK
jgi:hypothetical protein